MKKNEGKPKKPKTLPFMPKASMLISKDPPRVYMEKDVLDVALEWGYYKPGWKVKDYILEAVKDPRMTTTIAIWGPTGAGKSSMMLLHGYWAYQDWEEVLDHIMFSPEQIIETGSQLSRKNAVPWIAWDDIIVHFPSLSYRSKHEVYAALDGYFAIKRTITKNFVTTLPSIARLAKNIYDNVMLDGIEIHLSRVKYIALRCFQLPQLYTVRHRVAQFKVRIEMGKYDPYKWVPQDIFHRYERLRKTLGEEAAKKYEEAIKKMVDEIRSEVDPNKFLDIMDAAEILGTKPQSIKKNLNGIIRVITIDGKSYVYKEDLENYITKFGKPEQLDLYRAVVGKT